MVESSEEQGPRGKSNYIGAPACFALELACQPLVEAFVHYGLYQVGSSLERADWRDIDLRYILDDAEFEKLFPDAGEHWEFDPRWLLMTTAVDPGPSDPLPAPISNPTQPPQAAKSSP